MDDGVLWTSLGPDPNLTTTLGTCMPRSRTTDRVLQQSDAYFHLSEVIGDRRLLIVLDDAWESDHVRPFPRGGPNCARLVISSNSDLLPDAARISLGE